MYKIALPMMLMPYSKELSEQGLSQIFTIPTFP
jgi:hypothetical protein